MLFDRRRFLKIAGLAAASAATPRRLPGASGAEDAPPVSGAAQAGCLVDTTLCIGCRKCEEACNLRNKLRRPETPFAGRTVFRRERRPSENAFTVVNEYPGPPSPDQTSLRTTYVKVQCLHCLTPACVSACIVGAMTRAADGAILYNPKICIGCRYCMIACPFQIPAYEYAVALSPRVRKCEFCASLEKGTGADPACAASCPTEALVFGRRESLLVLAKDRIAKRPDRYVERVYGETESGGTSWLYLTGRPGREVGLIDLPSSSPASRTESIQHGIFRYGIIPFAVYGILGGVMWANGRRSRKNDAAEEKSDE
jgi:Fe-S-cluster-containing dehydrogenase component